MCDTFSRLLAFAEKKKMILILCHMLTYQLKTISLALTHSDATLLKTNKATLTTMLEGCQTTVKS